MLRELFGARGRLAISITLLCGIAVCAAGVIGCGTSSKYAEGTSVTLANGETAGVIVTIRSSESNTDSSDVSDGNDTMGFAGPAVSNSAADDIILAATSSADIEAYSFRFENKTITPGDNADDVIASLAAKADVAEEQIDKDGASVTAKVYKYDSFIIYALPGNDGSYYIDNILLATQNSVTPEGIGIGSDSDSVILAYGKNYTDNGDSLTFTAGDTSLTFFFAQGKVSDINYAVIK